jgi:UDP-perosamine 4-acetyltransferase
MKEKIILIGAGGHARVLIDLIRLSGLYEIAGIVDSQLKLGEMVSGITVLGDDDDLGELYSHGLKYAIIAVGSIKNNFKRRVLYERIKEIGFSVPCLFHPKAIIAGNVQILEGAQIMAGAIIQVNSTIGENTIINTGAILEHDCQIGMHVHICPGATISGECNIGVGAFIGAGATVIQGLSIGNNAVVAAGAVVISDVPDNTGVMGVPAKIVI